MNFAAEEKKLACKLVQIIQDDFVIVSESQISRNPGRFMLDEIPRLTIPDLLLKPKPHLIELGFVDSLVPVEIKKFVRLDTDKFEDLMCQCHSYRFSLFDNVQPRLCLYFIDSYFDLPSHYQTEKSLDNKERTQIWNRKQMGDKKKMETVFGRFGIGEILIEENGYKIRIKRQALLKRKKLFLYFPNN